MANDSEVNVKIGADIADLKAKLGEATSAFKSSTDQIKENANSLRDQVTSSMAGVSKAFGLVTLGIAAITTALAGGAAMRGMVEKSIEMSSEANKLSKALGITVSAAGVLADALGDVGSSAEQYISVSQRLGRQVKTNEDGLKAMGVETRNADGTLKNQRDIMSAALKTVGEYTVGIDRNQAAMAIFGGRVGDLSAMLRVNDEKLKEVAETQKLLGSEITPANIAAMRKYKDTMADVHNVLDAVQKAVGDVVIPRLTALGEWFASIGPAAVRVMREAMNIYTVTMDAVGSVVGTLWEILQTAFKGIGDISKAIFGSGGQAITALEFFVNVLKVVQVSVIVFREAFEQAFNGIQTLLRTVGIALGGFAATANAALHFDFAGAKAAMKATSEDIVASLKKGMTDAVEIARKGRTDIDNALLGVNKAPSGDEKPKIGKAFAGSGKDKGAGADKSQMAVYEEQLIATKIALIRNEGRLMQKAEEEKFWIDIKALHTTSANDGLAIDKKIATDRLAIEQVALVNQITNLDFQGKLVKIAEDSKIAILRKTLEDYKKIYGEDSQNVKAVQAQLNAAMQKASDDRVALAQQEMELKAKIYGKDSEQFRKAEENKTIVAAEEKSKRDLKTATDALTASQSALNIAMHEGNAAMQQADLIDQQLTNTVNQLNRAQKAGQITTMENANAQVASRKLAAEAAMPLLQSALAFAQAEAGAAQSANDFYSAQSKILDIQNRINQATYDMTAMWASTDHIRKASTDALSTALSSIFDGTKKAKDAFLDMFKSIEKAITDMVAKNLAEKLMNSLFRAGGSGPGGGGGFLDNLFGSLMGAGQPVSAGAGLGTFGSIFSSAGGEWSVPADRLNFVHKNETILPASMAQKFRDSVEGGGKATTMQVTNNFTVSGAVDRSTQDQIAMMAATAMNNSMRRNG